MHRRILVTLGLFLVASATAQDVPMPTPAPAQPPPKEECSSIPANWPGLEYAEVRAYLYNPGEKPGNLILQKDKLHPEVTNPDGIKLDAAQVERLIATFRGKAANGMGVGCFEPHHGFVFYDRAGKPVADVTVCFLCIQGIAHPGPAMTMTTWDWEPLKRLVADLGLPVFKTLEDAEAHFIELAPHWPDAKVKEAVAKYILGETKGFPRDDYPLLKLLESLGERTHPFLLAHLAEIDDRSDWVKRDPASILSTSRFARLCNVFGDAPPAAAVPLLEPFLDEADVLARRIAITTITATGAPEIVPIVRKALAQSNREVSAAAVSGLQVAIDRGALDADTKVQLFPDVKGIEGMIGHKPWAEALIGLDSNKALELFVNPGNFNAASPRLGDLLAALCETKSRVPRDRIIPLIAQLRTASFEDQQGPLELALVLLGRLRNPADLELLRGMGDEALAIRAMPGLLAWHGLEGYRDRISKLEEEKGFAALNETQRMHVAAGELVDPAFTFYGYFASSRAKHRHVALAALKTMECNKQATILEEAIAKFGENGPSDDDEVRWTQLQSLGDDTFDELGERLGEAKDSLNLSLDRFAIKHAESFK